MIHNPKILEVFLSQSEKPPSLKFHPAGVRINVGFLLNVNIEIGKNHPVYETS